MPQNRLKYFPTAVLRRGMAHFHPALPMPGYLPARHDEAHAYLCGDAGGPRPTGSLTVEPDERTEPGAGPSEPGTVSEVPN